MCIRDSSQAARWLRLAANQGHPQAQYAIGILYAKGRGIPKSLPAAATWIKKAAWQGHLKAQFKMGIICALGRGVPLDPGQALKWFLKWGSGTFLPSALW